MTELRERFTTLVRRLGGSGDARPEADALLAAWAQPARAYHGTAHLVDCLARLDELPVAAEGADPIEAALWYHDAVYDPRAEDNEERSAAWAERALAGLGIAPGVAAEVARLVRLTRHAEPATDEAGRLVGDIDLSVLGRSPAEFDAYDAAIRAEYAWVPEEAFREGRRRVLRALLAREPLYGTERFRRRYEQNARANLRRALARLGEATERG
jgi:predicted metal-dependent HD superfamily phosphohydrolase